jgi:hypothetical protein
MQAFYIEELRVSGKSVSDAVIRFNDGVNLIIGRSNTGKTWVLKCISYLFGSSNEPFPIETGYTDVEADIYTKRFSRITIKRVIGADTALVTSYNNIIESGEYSTDNRKKRGLYLNDLWLSIIGADRNVMVPKNMYYEREKFSWVNLSSVFYIDEDEISKTGSIILKGDTQETSLIASLIYIYTGDYQENASRIDKPQIANARKDSVKDFIKNKIDFYTKEKGQISSKLNGISVVDVNGKIEKIEQQIALIQEIIERNIDERSVIIEQESGYLKRENELKILLDRYEDLVSQYKADLKRLEFISQGEVAFDVELSEISCPVCGGNIKRDKQNDCYAAVRSETKRIVSEIEMAINIKDEIQLELNDIEKQLNELRAKDSEFETRIEVEKNNLKLISKTLHSYENILSLSLQSDFIEEQIRTLQGDMKEIDKKSDKCYYRAKDIFDREIGSKFNAILHNMLVECDFKGYTVVWDKEQFDLLIDGIPKAKSEGKGYRSFLNTITGLLFFNYFNNNGAFIKPGFFMVDTPSLGLDINENGFDGTLLKTKLYRYLLTHDADGQVIIVDNISNVPDLKYEEYGVNVIKYHKDFDGNHLYGFLPSWNRDLPKKE